MPPALLEMRMQPQTLLVRCLRTGMYPERCLATLARVSRLSANALPHVSPRTEHVCDYDHYPLTD